MEVEKKKALLANIIDQRGSSIIRHISINQKQIQLQQVDKTKSKRNNFAKRKTLGTQFLKDDILKAANRMAISNYESIMKMSIQSNITAKF